MSVEVQILNLSQATSEGFLAWQKLLGSRLHLSTADPRYWTQCWSKEDHLSLEDNSWDEETNQLGSTKFRTSWKFAFVYRYDDDPNPNHGSAKRSIIGILPFQLTAKDSLQNYVHQDSSVENKTRWLIAKRDSRPQKTLRFSDSLEFGGGPIGNQPTATLMATFRYLNSFLPEDTVWKISLQNTKSPLASRFDTVLRQFPARFHHCKKEQLGWILKLHDQIQLEKLRQYFLLEHLEVSRSLSREPFGDQEVFLQSKDYLLVGHHSDPLNRSGYFPVHLFNRNQPRLDPANQQETYQIFIPDKSRSKTESDQTDWHALKKLATDLDLPEWTGTKTIVSSPNFWQRLFSTKIASH